MSNPFVPEPELLSPAHLADVGRTLSYARNMLGPLDDGVLARFHAFLICPCEVHWDDIHGLQVSRAPFLTVWQSILLIEPTFPRIGPSTDLEGNQLRGWSRVPSAELLADTLYFVLR